MLVLREVFRGVRRRLTDAFDWCIRINHFPEEQRKLLRPFFWIGFDSLWDLSGRSTYRRTEAAQRELKAYYDRKHRECETDWDRIGQDFRRILRESEGDKS